MLVIIAGVFCMLLAFSSMWLAWYVLMPHNKIQLPGEGTIQQGHVAGGSVREILEEGILHHHHNAPKS